MSTGLLLLALVAPSLSLADTDAYVLADAIQPQLVAANAETFYLACLHRGNYCVSESVDGGKSFADPVVAIDCRGRARGGAQRGPRLGIDARGRLTLTAFVVTDPSEEAQRYPTGELYLATSSDRGKTWTAPTRINEIEKKAPEQLHALAVSSDGDAHVAWLDLRGRKDAGQDLYYARVHDGKVGKNIKVAELVCECCAPGITVDRSGRVTLAWRAGGAKENRAILFAQRRTDAADFAAPEHLNLQPSNVAG
ncbi:MAG: hypothetical protein ACKVX7_11350 [Planctomycetota bacterium]